MRKRIDICVGCGEEFEQELKQGRPRVYCEICRPIVAPRASADGPLVDPPVRPRCAQCGKPRKVTKAVRKYAGDQIDRDPFCSTVCCRRYHGITFAADGADEELAELRSTAAAKRNAERKLAAGIAA